MGKFVLIAGVSAVIASLVVFALGIWTTDERWFSTGMLILFPGIVAVIAGSAWMSVRSF